MPLLSACRPKSIAYVERLLWVLLLAAGIAHAQPPGDGGDRSALQMPFNAFAASKHVSPVELAAEIGLPADEDLTQPLAQIIRKHGLSPTDIQQALAALDPVAGEAEEKDWGKIRLKFVLWVAFFLAGLVLLTRNAVSRGLRIAAMALAAAVFGVWLGVEPNAPGTVKDALVLYGEQGVIFPPRMIAFAALILMSIVGNKLFCGWGCQFGALQDLVSHLPTRKLKPPFWLSNLVRSGFFAVVAVAALSGGTDILEPVDPFRIFRLGAASAVAVAVVVLVAGIWIYRPWCNFLCLFGLISWVAERLAITKPRVNHSTCIDCKACELECPTHSMQGLRAGRVFAQDCFACGACIRKCPVDAIRWGLTPPPSTRQDGS